MRILIISNLYPSSPYIKDQTGVMLLHQYARCWSQKNDVTVINPHSYNVLTKHEITRKKLIDRFEIEGITVYNHSVLRLPGDKLLVKKFTRIISDLGSFDVIIGCLPVGLEVANYASKELGFSYFAYLHNSDFHRSGVSKDSITKKYKKFLRDAAGIAFVSPKLKIAFKPFLPDLDTFILPGAISKSWPEGPPKRDFISKKLKLITAGKLVLQKNVDSILYALLELNEISFNLDIAGDGEDRSKLEEIVYNQPNLERSISFKGMVTHEQLRDLYDHNDFMLLLSTNESFGLVYIEAMSRGCIPIGTKGEGIDGIIINGQNGFLCNPDPQSIKELLLEISTYSSETLSKISRKAVDTAKGYVFEDLAKSFLDFIKKKLSHL